MRRTNHVVLAIWVLLALFALTLADWQFGGLRFVSPRANLLSGIAGLWLPVACVALLGFLPRSRARLWAFACLIPAALLCLVLGSASGMAQGLTLRTRHASIPLGGSEIVTYFDDAGAWDSGDVVVQQEIKLLPGLLWVKPLSSKECLRDVRVTVLDHHHVRCDYVADKADTLDPHPEAQRDDVWVF
jgi:hypothetical protein